jgi:uncharacterized protein
VLRAVLDANVYVSALLRPEGPPGRIVERFLRGAFELVVSPAIVAEVARALTYPKLRRYLREGVDPGAWLEDILMLADLIAGEVTVSGVSIDPGDDKYLAAALEGRAAFVATGDQALLSLHVFEGVRIVNPREFLGTVTADQA